MIFDVLILGGGAAGMSCALVLGSAQNKPFGKEKRIGIVLHQRSSALDRAVFYNALGLEPGLLGKDILQKGADQLSKYYPDIKQITKEKVVNIEQNQNVFAVKTNKNSYFAKKIVIAIGPSNLNQIAGIKEFIIPHQKIEAVKERIQLKNTDHLVKKDMYVAGVLAGHRSQFAIACGSGAAVATDILTEWNHGKHTMIHDAID
ncbi:FAD-dependent oxidoreductase [Namhaeicola litoreus]|uniref:FAD-dependent oxidoreductase n=1 Tax=Namhaeicola litoreus TaxID=1052145 RepID=A0ABW3XZR2_9FLAO